MSQVWLITGSSRGLGRALAEVVLAAGHKLIATARQSAQLSDLKGKYGDQVRLVDLDVTDAAAALDAVRVARDAFGRLDVLANNAGYGNIGSVEDTSLEEFHEIIETGAWSSFAIFLRRRTGRGDGAGSLFGREMGRRRLLGSAGARGRATRHQGDDHRAGRIPDGLRRSFHDHPRGASRV